MDMKRKFAFIKISNFSQVNDHVLKILKDGFPDLEVEVIDVRDWIKIRCELIRDPDVIGLAATTGLDEFGVARTEYMLLALHTMGNGSMD